MKASLLSVVGGLAFVLALQQGVLPVREGEARAAGVSGKPTFALEDAKAGKTVFKIQGMSCAGCEKAVQAKLRRVPGVKEVVFRKGKDSKGLRTAEVIYAKGAQVNRDALVQAVEKAGYQARLAN